MRVISFKVWGDYAHFRRHYTTSSPLTHSIQPPSALRGLIGAIMGLSRDECAETLEPSKTSMGIRLLHPVKKVRLGINYMDTKDGSWTGLDLKNFRPIVKKYGPGIPRLHTQIRMEFLKDPAFEVFFHHTDETFMDNFAKRLKSQRTVFTPYLGITECIANFKFLWEEDVQPFEGVSNILSAFRISALKQLKIKDGTGIIKERVPMFINAQRIREFSVEIVFNPYAKPVTAEVDGTFKYPGSSDETFTFIG